jgi:sugar-phosphatase
MPEALTSLDAVDPLAALADLPFDAVIFDLDGTLVDSTAAVRRSWLAWAEAEGVDPARLSGVHGVPAAQTVAAVLPTERVASALARIDAIEVLDTDGVVALPGAVRALTWLPHARTTIATSCRRVLATARITAAGLSVPPEMVTADDVEVGKPDPAPYRLAAYRLGVDPSRCLVVEDAPAGITSAQAAGCSTLAVTTTYPAGELDADAVVGTLADVAWSVDSDGVRVTASDHAGWTR